nr:SDR family oxidoreductase [Mesorhizobium kowhaii]
MKHAGRVVIITGAAGGIGRALVDVLAGDRDTIVAVDLPGSGVVELARDLGEPHLGLRVRCLTRGAIVALYGRVEAQFGQIGVLINNAGVGPTMAATVDTDVDAFRRGLAVNLMGPFLMAREAARRMRPGGAIVNLASMSGVASNLKRNAYTASKAGLISLTKSLACEWARRVPMGRMARPDEIARAVRFLASAKAGYVTGSVLVVDGGWISFNQPGDASPEVEGSPRTELSGPAVRTDARVVLVTGGANGVGAAVALRLPRTVTPS